MEEFRFTDEKKFCHDMIKLVSRNSSYTLKEIKSSIILGYVTTMVRMHSSPHVDGGFTVSEDDASDICEEIFDWVAGVELARLAAEDVIDAYWDDDKNGMYFKLKKQL